MPAIKVLSTHLVNKIAAGEVVERPASVVKELVENALDAGASTIDITVEDGGRRMISIRDNGAGMGADDLALAFSPHATSKITDEDDLFNIHTMGFRGEALASISAVAHVHAVTRRRIGSTGVSPVRKEEDTGETPVLRPVEQDSEPPYDDDAKVRKRQGAYLPHWTRDNAAYAVTFRLADSMPRHVLEGWLVEKESLIHRAREQKRELTEYEKKELEHLQSEKVERYLDSGHGACHLRDERIAALVSNALKQFDGERYVLHSWSVMPNHVHVVVQPLKGNDLPDILHSWKSYTAHESNKILGLKGEFWRLEYYDHLVRDEKDFRRCVRYAYTNPEKAGLENWPWKGLSRDLEFYWEEDKHERNTGVPPVKEEDTGETPVLPDCGFEIRAEGETISPVRPAPASAGGTTITVRDLFFNTPGRRKFMRTANTEFGHIVTQLTRLALPNCNAAFSLTHNGRSVHRLPADQSLRERIAELLGAELAQSLIELNIAESAAQITGLIAPPHQSRTSTRWQYFFVNGRYVRDRTLSHALREAYRGLVEPARAPAAVIFLELDPSEIDVNVHPTKIEVRFRNGQFIHSQLLAALRETLNKADIAPSVDIGPAEMPTGNGRRESLKQSLADFFKSGPKAGNDHGPTYQPARAGQYTPAPSQAPTGAPPLPAQMTQATEALPLPPRLPRRAMQIHNSYIVTATDDGLAVIDQHALHERIIFDKLKGRLSTGKLTSQRLLIPETVEVGEADKTVLSERADMLERFGLEITEFGPGSVAVHALPSLLVERHVPAAEFVQDLLETLAENASAGGDELLDQILATMACKAAVKAGESLTPEEIDSLLARREKVDKSASCPHGRPTTLTLTLAELEKQFKRT